MPIRLVDALASMLDGWQQDLSAEWQTVFEGVELGFDEIDPQLTIEPFEPIFPGRKGWQHLGAAAGAHMFRAFDDIEPGDVSCVLLGQDPYPCMAFSTGRAFDCGSYGCWRDLDDMFTHSMRNFTQCVCAVRTGRPALAESTLRWAGLLAALESGEIVLESPKTLARRWVQQGVLLLNSSLTISRFAIDGDPHQLQGHLPLWRPLMVRLLQHLLARSEVAVPIVLFGEIARDTYRVAREDYAPAAQAEPCCIETEHPAAGDDFLTLGNPLLECNNRLLELGREPIRW